MAYDLLVEPHRKAAVSRSRRAPPSAWPARLDLLQSVSGLLLVLFLGAHTLFVSSILVSEEAMYTVTKAFEGYYIFGVAYPWLVSLGVAGVMLLFLLHGALAMRKFPSSYRQFKIFNTHNKRLHHSDTRLWIIQVYSGFALFFLGSAHLGFMLVHPDQIGPYASADRVWAGSWVIDLPLLLVVQVHAGIGLYRLAVKWNWFQTPAGAGVSRLTLRRVIFSATAVFALVGLLSIGSYVKIGYEHREHAGERYVPLSKAQIGHDRATS